MSIKRRLLLWLLSGLAILGLCFVLANYLIDRALLRAIYNDQLRQIADAIPLRFKAADLEQEDPALHYDRDNFILQIWEHDGPMTYHSNDKIVLPLFLKPGFRIVRWRGERWKLFVRVTEHNTIQVAQSLSGRNDLAAVHAWHELVPLVILLLVIAVLTHWSVGKGLESLTQLSRELETRNSDTLGRLDAAHQPAELIPLTSAMNTLMHRLGIALESQKKFIADASHELRTPLATLQIQTQLVEQSLGTGHEDQALGDLKAGIKRTSHLLEQLLLFSRLESGGMYDIYRPLPLHDIVRQVTIDFLPYANTCNINLGVEHMDEATVRGSEHHLTIMIRNLIDNAVRYTPGGGQVDVVVRATEDAVVLAIDDSGPGIAPEERERVFHRFYRCLVPQAAGSGLGLAIVRQVADLHQAEVTLGRAYRLGGLSASVRFKNLKIA